MLSAKEAGILTQATKAAQYKDFEEIVKRRNYHEQIIERTREGYSSFTFEIEKKYTDAAVSFFQKLGYVVNWVPTSPYSKSIKVKIIW